MTEDTQRNNDIAVVESIVGQCMERRPPYDEGLIACFVDARGDCARYRKCADGVVAARPRE